MYMYSITCVCIVVMPRINVTQERYYYGNKLYGDVVLTSTFPKNIYVFSIQQTLINHIKDYRRIICLLCYYHV